MVVFQYALAAVGDGAFSVLPSDSIHRALKALLLFILLRRRAA